jgi:hypothetical protein
VGTEKLPLLPEKILLSGTQSKRTLQHDAAGDFALLRHARLPRSWRAPRNTWHRREKRRKAAQDRMTETVKIATCFRFLELCRLRQIVDCDGAGTRRNLMNGLIYLVGLIVVILAILSFFGLR